MCSSQSMRFSRSMSSNDAMMVPRQNAVNAAEIGLQGL